MKVPTSNHNHLTKFNYCASPPQHFFLVSVQFIYSKMHSSYGNSSGYLYRYMQLCKPFWILQFVFFFKASSLEFSYTILCTHWKLYTFILYQYSVPKEIESLVDDQIHVLGQKTKQNKIK